MSCWDPTLCAMTMAGLLFLGIFLGRVWGQWTALLEGQEQLKQLLESLHAEREGDWAGRLKDQEVIYIAKFGATRWDKGSPDVPILHEKLQERKMRLKWT